MQKQILKFCLVAAGVTVALGMPVHANSRAQPPTPHAVRVKRKPTDTTWKEYPVRTVADVRGLPTANPRLDTWGGRLDRKGKATGFFRVQKIGDRWWLIDPDGHPFIHVGVVSIDPERTAETRAAMTQTFGTSAKWAAQTTDLLRELGFNGAGNWSRTDLLGDVKPAPLVYAVLGNQSGYGFMAAFGKKLRITRPGPGHRIYPNDCLPLFHPDFPAFCDQYAKAVAKNKSDRRLLGYFSDNEMPVPRLEKYLALPPDDPAMGSSYKAAQTWLDARKGKEAATAEITDADREAWTEYAYDRYLSLTTGALRKYDPNHLCLGPRFYSAEKRMPGVWRVAGKYLDVIAINHYFVWDPQKGVAQYAAWANKPVLISEFYAKGMDTGFRNSGGAGWVLPTQEDRGLFYETFTLGLLESKACVGWHWFKYMDYDPQTLSNAAQDRESNKGLVNHRFVPYKPLADHMRAVNRRIYALIDSFDKK